MTRLAVKLMALTFVRTSELIGGKWEEFDLEATARWNIPKERMKMKAPPHRSAVRAGDRSTGVIESRCAASGRGTS